MRIASSNLEMASQHQASSSYQLSERLRVWRGNPPDSQPAGRAPGETQPFQVDISEAGRRADAAAGTADATGTDDSGNAPPSLRLVKTLVEMLLGHKIRLFSTDELAAVEAADAPPPPPRAGFGVEYDRQESYTEEERTTFQASGTVKTADGKEISFKLDLEMSRAFATGSSVSLRLGDAARKDPLVINFDGTGAELQDGRFSFDLDSDGQDENLPMLAGGSAFLALDRNGNGLVDSGQELFGPQSGDGFQDLAQLDGDGNGWLDDNDTAFGQLQAWIPDGKGGGTLQNLKSLGVGALSLANQATPFDIKDSANHTLGSVRSTAVYLNENGSVGNIQQVDLAV